MGTVRTNSSLRSYVEHGFAERQGRSEAHLKRCTPGDALSGVAGLSKPVMQSLNMERWSDENCYTADTCFLSAVSTSGVMFCHSRYFTCKVCHVACAILHHDRCSWGSCCGFRATCYTFKHDMRLFAVTGSPTMQSKLFALHARLQSGAHIPARR